MLSLSSAMTSGQAGNYFAHEDYYLRGGESSHWLGQGAEALRLKGEVKEAAFRNMASGKTPDGMRQLVAPKITVGGDGTQIESHRAGNDLTFSAPKSVSIGYAAGNQELKEIWDQAVVNTMKVIERHYSQYRTPEGVTDAGNLVAAKFDHVTSRSLDPEVHSHVFLVNMVQTGKEEWKANEPKNIYQDKIALGMMARQEAIRLYREAGYQVYFTDREKLLFEIKGVRQEELEAFSKRSQAIAEQVQSWKEEGKFPGVAEAVLKQMAALSTRDPKAKVTKEDVRREWDKGFEAAGTSATAVKERILAAKELAPEEENGFRHLPPGRYPEPLSTVINHTNLVTLKRKAGYEEAKRGGDPIAAAKVVDVLVKPEVIETIRRQIPEGAAVYVVPVLQREGRSLNMLPLAYADRLADELGGEVWTGIRKVSGRFNTDATLQERLKNIQIFDGELPPEKGIIIVVDDTFTVGGTLASLIDHLAASGRTPLCATTLAVGRYGKDLTPSKELIDGFLEKTGTDSRGFEREFGYPPESLTAAEIRSYLLSGGRGLDEARRRFYSRGSGEGPGKDQGVEKAEPAVEIPATNPTRVVAKAATVLTENEVIFDRAQLLKTAFQISGGEHGIEDLDDAVNKEPSLCFLGQERSGWQSGKSFYTTEATLKLEAQNVASLQHLPPFASVTSKAEITAYLKGLSGERETDLEPDEKRYLAAYRAGSKCAEAGERIVLSPGQKQHLMNELAGPKGFSVTQGDPGTGKTFAARAAEKFDREVLEPSNRKSRTVNLAYTGKAALEMEAASGQPSFTIDAFLNRLDKKEDPLSLLGIDPKDRDCTQIVVRIDEASFVGGKQASRLLDLVASLKKSGSSVKLSLVGDTKQMQSIQASPFFTHAADLARGGSGDYAVMKEITRQKEDSLLEVAKVLNRGPLGRNASDALQMLQQQGRVVEVAQREDLMHQAVERYLEESRRFSADPLKAAAGERQSVLLVTPLNSDRRELNERIRKARVEAGELGKGVEVEVLTPVEQGVTAACYRPGMVVSFAPRRHREATESGYAGRDGEVARVDLEKNQVTIRYKTGRGKVTREEMVMFEAPDLIHQTSLYRRERREFSAGDQVVFGKNTRGRSIVPANLKETKGPIGVRNGERGEITEITVANDDVVATVKLSSGRSVKMQLKFFGPQHIDHGYAVTIHKGQGETVDSVISYHYVPEGVNKKSHLEKMTGVSFSEEAFQRWNSGLSEWEKSYQIGTVIGGHSATVGFTMVVDRQNGQDQKGVAIRFANGKAVIADEQTRAEMREAGMHWSPHNEAWVTAATNEKTASLMTHHPLKETSYREHLKQALLQERTFSPSRESIHRSEIDTEHETTRFGRTSYNAFNVAITRARHQAAVFTNSVSGLKKAIQKVDEKTTTIGHHLGKEEAKAAVPPLIVSPAPKAPDVGLELIKKR